MSVLISLRIPVLRYCASSMASNSGWHFYLYEEGENVGWKYNLLADKKDVIVMRKIDDYLEELQDEELKKEYDNLQLEFDMMRENAF